MCPKVHFLPPICMQAVENTSSSRVEPDKLKLLVMNMKSASIFGGHAKKY